ncbi:prepilin-type N-terminal cleavage/methylation domain-containing protein [Mangrovimicrobium sediminis]|uniref:Prepilin-type N-terminal cleavage/methylation domain-containing protein n=1 Tax=Mangrovimicrobium sediminis TaxID=2562682 RepID=A0A4Z0M3Z4_9GAMM|nr:GspH/FimT family pseudopilin [Haliea sp. SAOS-164]TGD74025.1 prepilin-type N-terminal cleavage/methylation domain-containing protein [Haliea sp. SAOS-164]
MDVGWQRGFSLLEMLVALLVIVLATSLVSLNISSGNEEKRLEMQVREIAESASYALDEAQFTGMDYGLLLRLDLVRGEPHYTWEWRERGPTDWREPQSGKGVFDSGDLVPQVELQLELEEVIQPQDVFSENLENPPPQLIFYASGETPPGALEFRDERDGALLWRIEWDLLGDFRVLFRGEEDPEYEQ